MTDNLTTEELFEKYQHLAVTSVHRTFKTPSAFAKSRGLEYDDLIQYAYLGLLKGIKTYCPIKHKNLNYKNFLIRNIRWAIFRNLYMEGVNYLRFKTKEATDDNTVSVMSMSVNPYGDIGNKTYYDVISHDNIDSYSTRFPDPEKATISKLTAERMYDKIAQKDKYLINERLKENTYQEIADKVGTSKQNIGMKMKTIQAKYRDYLYGIAEVTS